MNQWKFWFQWVVLSAVGWAIGLLGAGAVNLSLIPFIKSLIVEISIYRETTAFKEVMMDNIGDGIPGDFIGVQLALIYGAIFGMIYGVTFGAIGGFAQSLILKRYISKTARWILASALAWGCVLGAIWASAWAWGWSGTIVAISSSYGLIGAIGIGIIEWLVLRERFSRAVWWIFATIITWIIGRCLVTWMAGASFFFPLMELWLFIGIGNGIITGGILMLLLPFPQPQNTSNRQAS